METDSLKQGHKTKGRTRSLGGRLGGMWGRAHRLRNARVLTILVIVAALALMPTGDARGQTAPNLGAAVSFGILGGSTVTNTGPTVINGDIGVSPGSAVTGFPPGVVVAPGAIHAGDAVAAQAQADIVIAYDALAGQACDFQLTGQDLGGLTLTSGVYCFDTSAQLTGQLTLNVQGDPNAVFIFKMGSTLTTASNSSVVFSNGGPSCNVFWQDGSSVTFGTATDFAGNVIALTSATLTTGASVTGKVLARNGAVTLDTNTILPCIAAPLATNTPTPVNTPTSTPTNTPTPTSTPPPSAVELLYFVGSRNGQTVALNWATAQEVDNYGFALYRAPVDDFAQAVLIHFEPSAIQGGTGSGTTYQVVDTPPGPGTWTYWLADVDTHSMETLHTPSVTVSTQTYTQIFLPWIGKY